MEQQRRADKVIEQYAHEHGLSVKEARLQRGKELLTKYAEARMRTRMALTVSHGHYNQDWEEVL